MLGECWGSVPSQMLSEQETATSGWTERYMAQYKNKIKKQAQQANPPPRPVPGAVN